MQELCWKISLKLQNKYYFLFSIFNGQVNCKDTDRKCGEREGYDRQ